MGVIETLQTYKSLSEVQNSQSDVLTDKKAILYAATLLESEDVEVLNLCLDILENYADEKCAHSFLLSTFGIYESIEALSIRTRDTNRSICRRAMAIANILRNSAPPAYNTRHRLKNLKISKRHHLHVMYIEGLNGESLLRLEEVMVKTRGVISFLVDIDMKRCTIRISPKMEINELVERIYKKTGLKCLVVVKNKITDLEEYVDVLKNVLCESYFEYPDVDTMSPKGSAVTETARNVAQSGNNFLKSIVNFWNDALYW